MREEDKSSVSNNEKVDANETANSLFSTFQINEIEYKVVKKSNSKIEGERLWLQVKNLVPIYYLDGFWIRKWSYNKKEDYILLFANTDEETLKHEIVHSIEYKQEPSKELEDLYSEVLEKITEDSFDNWTASFNFRKNIHEFIADGYSKKVFIEALKKENLYEEFLEKTAYLFE